MKQILCSDWLLGMARCVPERIFFYWRRFKKLSVHNLPKEKSVFSKDFLFLRRSPKTKIEIECLREKTNHLKNELSLASFWSHNKSFTWLAKLVRSRWRDIGLILFLRVSSRSICDKHGEKKNLANIPPSWPHTWPITHISILYTTG